MKKEIIIGSLLLLLNKNESTANNRDLIENKDLEILKKIKIFQN